MSLVSGGLGGRYVLLILPPAGGLCNLREASVTFLHLLNDQVQTQNQGSIGVCVSGGLR